MQKIMFSDKYGLTRAVLDGRKTQTRRIITCPRKYKSQNVAGFHIYKRQSDGFISEICMYDEDERDIDEGQILPIFKIGEIVAIAQSYKQCGGFMEDRTPRWDFISKMVGNKNKGWTNKMFVRAELMPHQIQITNIRVQKLQDISDEDCLKEGVGISKTDNRVGYPFAIPFNYYIKEDTKGNRYTTPREAYASLIDRISGKGTWDKNPYVWAYSFKLVK